VDKSFEVLAVTAVSLGFLHTITGPDHYIPFIAMSEARKWSRAKTALVTVAAGIGHILSSVVIAMVGLGLGLALEKMKVIESVRGDIATWFLIAFGAVYLAYGMVRAYRLKAHQHGHSHGSEGFHTHEHVHEGGHLHVHEHGKKDITAWILFTLLAFGPCEPLIPVLMVPALKSSIGETVIITCLFAVATITTMLVSVFLLSEGVKKVLTGRFARFDHAFAGGAILISGMLVKFMGF
jgi:nickel/cobalt transporter (NicO) family protein